jgi:molybdopterin molybdotransferase
MISFREALGILLAVTPRAAIEPCALEAAAGRVLREEIWADRDFPAFDRVMMDGYALRLADWELGHRAFRISGVAPAGRAAVPLSDEIGTCVEVMTGAPCPPGADCIVPVEELVDRTPTGVVFSTTANPMIGRHLHCVGSDAASGQILLSPGTVLGACQIGVAASCGACVVKVSALPRIAVVATGDELVAIHQSPEIYQIRQSNAHSLSAALARAGFAPQHVGVMEDAAARARPAMEALLGAHDWIVLTGAVSNGSRDFVPALLQDLGCRKHFHGVAQRPGKPAGCWIGPRGQMILALPGNPVSALTGLHAFVLPALIWASGADIPEARQVRMAAASHQLPEFTRHLPVTLSPDGSAVAAATGNSGDFIGLLKSEGFVTLPPRADTTPIPTGFPYTPWR